MKKLGKLSVWVALGLTLAMLGGCGAAEGESLEGTEVTVSTSENGNDSLVANDGAEEGNAEKGNAEREASEEEKASESETKAEDDRFKDRPNADDGGEGKVLSEGDVAPDFTAKLLDGSEFKLSDHDDGVVILNFFATWCGPCVKEMPAFGMLQDEYEDVAILCVNCMEVKKTVDAFVAQNGYDFPIAYDEDGRIEKYYPTDGIPYTLVINKGVIARIYLGARDSLTQYKVYKAAIDQCLSEN